MKKFVLLIFLSILLSCQSDENSAEMPSIETNNYKIKALDISFYPEIRQSSVVFFNSAGIPQDFLTILKENSINTIRLRLWVNPTSGHSGWEEVKNFSQELKSQGFKIWLTVHYSDTWADPGHQSIPIQWQGLSYNILKDSTIAYTQKICKQIAPDYFQIGNEINSGFLFPFGEISKPNNHFIELLQSISSTLRNQLPKTQIILHYAGIENAKDFFQKLSSVEYDIIGLSYYPLWHGKDLNLLSDTMNELAQTQNKKVLIAETAYPFTLQWNDWTNNIVGLESQLILPNFPASIDGQRNFVHQIKNISTANDALIGFCYWGAEWVAWKGNTATNGSSWENQALFDFSFKALPALSEFNYN